MLKNKALKKYDEIIGELDFFEDEETPGDESVVGILQGLIEASQHQQKTAIELTKLVVEKSSGTMTEGNVFSAFERATKVVAENFPLKELWEKFR
jgi:hypothetical protein